MSSASHSGLVLSVQPFSRGLAYALFESPLSPLDWGVKEIRSKEKNAPSLETARAIVKRLQPDALVLEAFGKGCRRSERIRLLQRHIVLYAETEVIDVHRYARAEIRECFGTIGALTRYEIAQAIAARIGALSFRLPPPPKPWKTDDPRMSLFDAASLVLTFYHHHDPIFGKADEPEA